MSNLQFDVRYYNDHHRRALQNLGSPHSIDDLVQNGLSVSRDEFFTYMLFREQRMHIPEWQTYSELRLRVPSRYQQIIENFDLSGGTVRSQFAGAGTLDNTMVEGAGVASGLVLANALFKTHEADWEKLPLGGAPNMDFQIASDGARFIQCAGARSPVDFAG